MPRDRARVPFSDLAQADLRLDAIYEGGSAGNAGDDPIRYLLPCGNQGGIRFRRNGERYAIAVLFTSGRDPDWPDFIDPASGLLTYFGDNKTPGHALHETARRGNVLLRECFASLHALSPERQLIPPFFVFESTGEGRDVRFRGLAAPGASELSAKDDLVAVWRSTGGERFQNYRARFTILDEPVVPRDWIDSLVAAEDPAAGAPAS